MVAAEVAPIGITIVFVAGVASFLSPCVLPLVPGYLSYMGGLSSADRRQGASLRLAAATGAFVLGFTTVFVSLGLSASVLGSFLAMNREITTRVAGGLIVIMGLVFIGAIPIPWLYREKRLHVKPAQTITGTYLVGLAFGFGWTPCIGPALAAALAIAATEQTAAQGAALLFAYAMGLGVPFMASALGVSRLVGTVKWLRKHQRALMTSSGVLLIAVGLLFVFNRVFLVSIWIQNAMTAAGLDFWNRL